jgi:hypothetical protein
MLCAVCLGGCIGAIDEGPESAQVRNDTAHVLEIYLELSTPSLLATVEPGSEEELFIGFGSTDCTDLDLVARTVDGEEVDRRRGPNCKDDLWIVEGDPGS